MDGPKFDAVVRALGADGTRRGFVGLLAALAAGGAAADAGAKRRCRSDSPAGQCCKRKGGVVACTCTNGGTVCGVNCCLIGQDCEAGQCVEMPEPTTCAAFGEACKNTGVPCCDNLVCGSGQGGSEVACWVRKTGRCDRTAECVYGTECQDGICVGLPPAPTCDPAECCDVLSYIDAAVEKACVGGECTCTCKAGKVFGYTWLGVSCTAASGCTTGNCYDMAINSTCTANSKLCCCWSNP